MLICFGTYNIRNEQNGGLESALWGMGQSNVDVGVFQETKLIDGIYTRELAGYKVVATSATNQYHRGVVIFYRDSTVFTVKAIRQFGANVIMCHLEMRKRRWYIVRFFLAPSDDKKYWGRGHGDVGEAEGEGVDCYRRLQLGPREYVQLGTVPGDCIGGGNGRPRRSCGALPSATAGVAQGSEGVGGCKAGEGITVTDGMNPWI